MKLYRYFKDYGRMGSIEGLLILTDEEKEKLEKYSNYLHWDELLGKHSEGVFDFSDETLTEIEIPENVVQILLDNIGQVISGPFDMEYFDEMIDEVILDEEHE